MKKIVSILLFLCVLPYFLHASFPVQKTTELTELSVEGDVLSFSAYERNITICWIGFVLDFLLNIVGVGIAYLITKDYQL
ncbi:hypothetical protein N9E30_03080 [Flavobacteriales bacterium]|nr:hypothetical protein [Flavobacteriales bacterium]